MLHRDRGHDERVLALLDEHPRLDECVRPQHALGVRHERLEAQGGRRLVDLVVEHRELAIAELLRTVAVVDLDHHLAPRLCRRDLGQAILGHREEHRGRIHRADHDQAVRVGRVYEVAGVDLTNAGDPVEWRFDLRVVELELRILDLRFVDRDRAGVLADLAFVLLDLLRGDELLLLERLVALVRLLRREELRLVARERALRLMELDLERPRIDLGDHVALLDRLAFGEQHLVEPAVDLRTNRDLLERRDGAQAVEPDRQIALGNSRDLHGHDARIGGAAGGPWRAGASRFGMTPGNPPRDHADHRNGDRDAQQDRPGSRTHLSPR